MMGKKWLLERELEKWSSAIVKLCINIAETPAAVPA